MWHEWVEFITGGHWAYCPDFLTGILTQIKRYPNLKKLIFFQQESPKLSQSNKLFSSTSRYNNIPAFIFHLFLDSVSLKKRLFDNYFSYIHFVFLLISYHLNSIVFNSYIFLHRKKPKKSCWSRGRELKKFESLSFVKKPNINACSCVSCTESLVGIFILELMKYVLVVGRQTRLCISLKLK